MWERLPTENKQMHDGVCNQEGQTPFLLQKTAKRTQKRCTLQKKLLHRHASKDRTHSKMSSHAVNAKAVFQQGTLLHEIDGETACCKGL